MKSPEDRHDHEMKIRFTAEMYLRILKLAKQRDIPPSVLLREMINEKFSSMGTHVTESQAGSEVLHSPYKTRS